MSRKFLQIFRICGICAEGRAIPACFPVKYFYRSAAPAADGPRSRPASGGGWGRSSDPCPSVCIPPGAGSPDRPPGGGSHPAPAPAGKCNSFKDTHRQSALTDTHERRPQPSRKGKKILCIFSLAKSLESVYNKNE